jgi:hypothetical protein
MVCEFFWEDLDYLRYFTAIPFSLGLLFVVYYYVSELSLRRKLSIEDDESNVVEAGE